MTNKRVIRTYTAREVCDLTTPPAPRSPGASFAETTSEAALQAVLEHAKQAPDLSEEDRKRLRAEWDGAENGPNSNVDVFVFER